MFKFHHKKHTLRTCPLSHPIYTRHHSHAEDEDDGLLGNAGIHGDTDPPLYCYNERAADSDNPENFHPQLFNWNHHFVLHPQCAL